MNTQEYRVHIFRGTSIDFVQKKRRNGAREQENYENFGRYIRNHGDCWVFARSGVELPECAEREARAAVEALGLDFGAVDLLVRDDRAYILEVNSAPGLDENGTTLTKYVEAISNYVNTI